VWCGWVWGAHRRDTFGHVGRFAGAEDDMMGEVRERLRRQYTGGGLGWEVQVSEAPRERCRPWVAAAGGMAGGGGGRT
jgi:hypothetical protein